MDILDEILRQKRIRVEAAKREVPLAQTSFSASPHRLRHALSTEGVNIIAEFKRRSPSKGIINAGVTPEAMGQSYEAGGAAAMSVLTEADYFFGSLEDLQAVKKHVQIPVLRKDFVFDEYQVYESAHVGADAVLLIVAALDDATLVSLRRFIEDELGMDALVEVHDEAEFSRAVLAGATLIGVNNRNLRTFQVSLDTSLMLAKLRTPDMILVSESGISTRQDIQLLHDAGYSGFLIGESFMRSSSPTDTLRELTTP
jgi:indole-3-glycerol phosphate synthase